MDAPESTIWKLKRSACRTLSNIVKRMSSHSAQWSDSHTRVGNASTGGWPTWKGKVENLRAWCCCLHSSGSVSPVGCNRFRCLIWRLVFTPSPGQQWKLAATTAAVWGEMTTPIVENTHKQTCDGLQRCSVLPVHTVYLFIYLFLKGTALPFCSYVFFNLHTNALDFPFSKCQKRSLQNAA